jgi:hypothetical protein
LFRYVRRTAIAEVPSSTTELGRRLRVHCSHCRLNADRLLRFVGGLPNESRVLTTPSFKGSGAPTMLDLRWLRPKRSGRKRLVDIAQARAPGSAGQFGLPLQHRLFPGTPGGLRHLKAVKRVRAIGRLNAPLKQQFGLSHDLEQRDGECMADRLVGGMQGALLQRWR